MNTSYGMYPWWLYPYFTKMAAAAACVTPPGRARRKQLRASQCGDRRTHRVAKSDSGDIRWWRHHSLEEVSS